MSVLLGLLPFLRSFENSSTTRYPHRSELRPLHSLHRTELHLLSTFRNSSFGVSCVYTVVCYVDSKGKEGRMTAARAYCFRKALIGSHPKSCSFYPLMVGFLSIVYMLVASSFTLWLIWTRRSTYSRDDLV